MDFDTGKQKMVGPDGYEHDSYDPSVRLILVALVAAIVGVLLHVGVVTLPGPSDSAVTGSEPAVVVGDVLWAD